MVDDDPVCPPTLTSTSLLAHGADTFTHTTIESFTCTTEPQGRPPTLTASPSAMAGTPKLLPVSVKLYSIEESENAAPGSSASSTGASYDSSVLAEDDSIPPVVMTVTVLPDPTPGPRRQRSWKELSTSTSRHSDTADDDDDEGDAPPLSTTLAMGDAAMLGPNMVTLRPPAAGADVGTTPTTRGGSGKSSSLSPPVDTTGGVPSSTTTSLLEKPHALPVQFTADAFTRTTPRQGRPPTVTPVMSLEALPRRDPNTVNVWFTPTEGAMKLGDSRVSSAPTKDTGDAVLVELCPPGSTSRTV